MNKFKQNRNKSRIKKCLCLKNLGINKWFLKCNKTLKRTDYKHTFKTESHMQVFFIFLQPEFKTKPLPE